MFEHATDSVLHEIDVTEARLRSLAEPLEHHPDLPLLEGDWTVRDTLCHVAARANDVAPVLQWAGRPPSAASTLVMEIDSINARQIADRSGRSVAELVQEALQGYSAAREDVARLTPEQLDRVLPDVGGSGPMKTADLLVMVYRMHAQGHLASIERALAVGVSDQ